MFLVNSGSKLASRVVLAAALLSPFAGCKAQATYTIEDERMRALPVSISAAIQADTTFAVFADQECGLVGRTLSLSSGSKSYFVTTADACGWGTSLGPIWLVTTNQKGIAGVILYAGGYSLDVIPSRYSTKDVVIKYEAGGRIRSSRYHFEGKKYVPRGVLNKP